MSVSHDDLVAFALGELDGAEAERIRKQIESDPVRCAELKQVKEHLSLHDLAPRLAPAPALWRDMEKRIASDSDPRGKVKRYWMPFAAAALVAAAFVLPDTWTLGNRPPALSPLFGSGSTAADNSYTSSGVSRLGYGQGIRLTVDDGATLRALTPTRLAMITAGRVFFEVEPSRVGLTVEAGGARIVTTGTAFLVELREGAPPIVAVTRGSVRYEFGGTAQTIGAGDRPYCAEVVETLRAADPLRYATAWFQRPSLTAHIIDRDSILVVLTNEMPDPIELAPPTGGEPFCFVRYEGHNYPLTPAGFESILELQPGDSHAFQLFLPKPLEADRLEEGPALSVSVPGAGTVEARR